MQKLMKLTVMASLVALFALVAAGCGGPKTSPEDSIRVYANMVVKADFSEAAKVGYSEEEVRLAKEDHIKDLDKQSKILFESADTKATAEAKERFSKVIMRINDRVDVKTELVSKQDKTATVKVAIRSLGMEDFANNTLYPESQKKMLDPSYDWTNQGANFITDMFEGVVDTLPQRAEPVTFEVKCVIDEKTNCWVPENLNKFNDQVLEANDGEM